MQLFINYKFNQIAKYPLQQAFKDRASGNNDSFIHFDHLLYR